MGPQHSGRDQGHPVPAILRREATLADVICDEFSGLLGWRAGAPHRPASVPRSTPLPHLGPAPWPCRTGSTSTRPDTSYNLRRHQLGGAVPGSGPASLADCTRSPPKVIGTHKPTQLPGSTRRRYHFVQRPAQDLRRRQRLAAGQFHADPAVRPVRRRPGRYSPRGHARLPAAQPPRRCEPLPLQPRSPRRSAQLRHPQITRGVHRLADRLDQLRFRQPRRPPGLAMCARTTWTRWFQPSIDDFVTVPASQLLHAFLVDAARRGEQIMLAVRHTFPEATIHAHALRPRGHLPQTSATRIVTFGLDHVGPLHRRQPRVAALPRPRVVAAPDGRGVVLRLVEPIRRTASTCQDRYPDLCHASTPSGSTDPVRLPRSAQMSARGAGSPSTHYSHCLLPLRPRACRSADPLHRTRGSCATDQGGAPGRRREVQASPLGVDSGGSAVPFALRRLRPTTPTCSVYD